MATNVSEVAQLVELVKQGIYNETIHLNLQKGWKN